uniref:Cytochrome P450 n=1 Tax=Megaselia scalaris TaxID=36166 RepID=T1GVN3_MEGSC
MTTDNFRRIRQDVIASIAFGLEANSFTNPQNEFRMAGLSVTDISLRRVVDAISIFFIPKLSPLVKAKLFPPIAENAFRRIFSYTIKNRRESGLFRNDLVDILIAFQDASKNGETEIEFTDNMLLAQAALFFLAGNETSSSAMSFALYELSKKPEIQEKLRSEIKSVYDKE